MAAVTSCAAIASGAILDNYHLGESDPGAVAGGPGNATTVDSGPGGHNLPSQGTPTYSNNVAAPGSTLSVAFDGSSSYSQSGPLTTLNNNVGIQAWIYPTVTNAVATIAYNGDSGANGFGLYQFLNSYNGGSSLTATIIGLEGGHDLGPAVNIPLNTWSEVTDILQNGQDQLYVNGVLTASKALAAVPASGGFFGIGGHGGEYFTGNIDEVQLFTVPEPASLGVIGLGGLGVLARRRRA